MRRMMTPQFDDLRHAEIMTTDIGPRYQSQESSAQGIILNATNRGCHCAKAIARE